MMPREIDSMYEARRRSIARMQRIIVAFVVFFWLAVAIAGVWLFHHPEAIGAFFGRIAAAYRALS